jgi:hypothetical protein
MLRDRGIKSCVLFWACLSAMQSCQVNKKVGAATQLVMDRVVFIPAAASGVFRDASHKIYSIDSLSDETPVVMKKMDIRFYNQRDTLRFNFENLKFHYSGDTLKYDEFVFPEWDTRKSRDTMQCAVNCFYSTPARPSVRCLQAHYLVVRGKLKAIEDFHFCP